MGAGSILTDRGADLLYRLLDKFERCLFINYLKDLIWICDDESVVNILI